MGRIGSEPVSHTGCHHRHAAPKKLWPLIATTDREQTKIELQALNARLDAMSEHFFVCSPEEHTCGASRVNGWSGGLCKRCSKR